MTDHEGGALARELIIRAFMAVHCRDPDHPTMDEMRAVMAELAADAADARTAD